MKKMVLGLSLSLAALALLLSPAMVAASPPSAAPAVSIADQAFLASLALQVGTPSPELAAKRPAIGQKSLCSATANCANGGTVSCSSNTSTTSCSAVDGNCPEPGHVTCNGVTTSCSACLCDLDCAAGRADCAASCDPCAFTYTCNLSLCTDHCHCKFNICPQ